MQSSAISRRFHLHMVLCAVAGLIACLLMCHAASLGIGDALTSRSFPLLVCVVAWAPLPAYWHEKKRTEMREAALVIPWLIFLDLFLPFPVEAAARSGFKLQDAALVRIDGWFGMNIRTLAEWSSQHSLGIALNWCYGLLPPLLLASIFVPVFTGRWRAARAFALANVAAFSIGILLFRFWPAVGPWYGEHFAPSIDQALCQEQLLGLRTHGAYIFNPDAAGIISFPSFHTVWAVICAGTLWCNRYLRWPAAVIAALIILSTMTTGWHYFTDVAAGIITAAFSLRLASCLATN